MKWLKKTKLVLILAQVSLSVYAGNIFNIQPSGRYVGQDGIVSNFKVTVNNAQAYPYAGVKIIENGHAEILKNSDCRQLPNGFCQMPITPGKSAQISILNTSNKPVKLQLALNVVGNKPISAYDYTIAATSDNAENSSGRIIGYLYGWETPPSAEAIAQAGYTHILIAFGLFSTTTPGNINIQAISGFDLTSYVQSLHQNGLKVLLSIGGASTNIPNTTVNFDDAVHAASTPQVFVNNFISSMNQLVSTYGFDGFDFDIESGLNAATSFTNPSQGCSLDTYSSTCDIYYLTSIINGFHSLYPSVYLTLAPQIANIAATGSFSSVWGNYASLIMQVYASLEWAAFQNYNSGCAYGIDLVCYPTTGSLTSTADPAVAFATDLLANWPATTSSGQVTGFLPYISYLKPSQVVIGYVVTNNNGQTDGDPSVSPYLSVVKNAIQCLRTGQQCDTYTPPTTYPGIGGVFDWTVNYDATVNYQFAKTLYPCVVGGNCS